MINKYNFGIVAQEQKDMKKERTKYVNELVVGINYVIDSSWLDESIY